MAIRPSERKVLAQPTIVSRIRRLPVEGRVLVNVGDEVVPDEVVARARLVGRPVVVRVAEQIGISAADVSRHLRCQPSELVEAGTILASASGPFGLRRRVCLAPISGVLSLGSGGFGEVVVQPPPTDIELRAHLPGRVTSIAPRRWLKIESPVIGIECVIGTGGEGGGKLLVPDSAREELDAASIDEGARGCILVGGSIGLPGLRRAAEVGVSGLIVGGMQAESFRSVSIEHPGLPVLITDGFGASRMATMAFDLLQLYQGLEARVSASSFSSADVGYGMQGSQCAEIVVPLPALSGAQQFPSYVFGVGSLVRVVAGPLAFAIATVKAVGEIPSRLPSGVTALSVQLELEEDGRQCRVPVNNVELVG